MRTPRARSRGASRAVCLVATLIAFASATAAAQVNAWVNPGSGNWDDSSSWSLGVLPDGSQSVLITNSLWKAVAINPSTPGSFPDAMTVSNLTIRGAWDTENTLLLNYFGTAVPLTVLNGLTLQDNAQLVNLNSGLVVQGGTITVTNAQIAQDGGLVRTTNATMWLQGAEYDLTNGLLEAGPVLLGLPVPARFNQYGGTAVMAALEFGRGPAGAGGAYALYGGDLSLPGGLSVTGENGSSASYVQAGGTNHTSKVFLGPGLYGASLDFELKGGWLVDDSVEILGSDFGAALLAQDGGTHVITNTLGIAGGSTHGETTRPGTYRLNDGTLSAGTLELNGNQGDAVFVQSNGATCAGTVYAHSVGFGFQFNTGLTLAGGTLSCSNFTTLDGGGRLNQSGGALVVSNLLDFGGSRYVGTTLYGRYTLSGGTLTASNINLTGDWIIGDSSQSNRISNPGYFSLSHTLRMGDAVEQLGRFILVSNATIDLAGSASRLGFAQSSGELWADGATLVVTNWNGNPSGGGAEQLRFGADASGLQPTQLSQLRFSFSSYLYSAKILDTGEVVPDQLIPPRLAVSRQAYYLVLTWPAGWTLQAATNVPGPYFDIPGATSPYNVDTTVAPQQFFRLRPSGQDWVRTSAPAQLWSSLACSADGAIIVASSRFSDRSFNPGAIYRSADFGQTWQPTGAPIQYWNRVVCSADGTRLAAIGATTPNFPSYSQIYLSTNSGATWGVSSAPADEWSVLTCSADGARLVAGIGAGPVYFSTDSGASWTQGDAPHFSWQGLTATPDGQNLAMSGWDPELGWPSRQVFLSRNGGTNWTVVPGSPNTLLAFAPSADGSRWFGAGYAGVYDSGDSGQTWQLTSCPTNGWLAIACSADASKVMTVATTPTPQSYVPGPIYASFDSGQTWAQSGTVTGYFNSVACSRDGTKWVAAEGGFAPGSIYTLAPPPLPPLQTDERRLAEGVAASSH